MKLLFWRTALLATLAMSGTALPYSATAIAQGSSSELDAGARIETVEVVPAAPIRIGMGDTLAVRFDFLDEDGARVQGFRWGFQFSPSIAGAGPDRTRGEGAFRIWGLKPGRSSLQIGVLVADDEGNPVPELVDQIEVTIEDWPVASIEIEEPRYAAYAGTTFSLAARVITTKETVHATATPLWRSETPDVVAITSSGVVTLLRPGPAKLTAGVGGVSSAVEFDVIVNPVTDVSISPGSATARTGDVVRFEITARDANGQAVEDAALSYGVQAIPAAESPGGSLYDDGAFVAEAAGSYRVFVSAGTATASAVVEATPRPKPTPVELTGRGGNPQSESSDLWVFTGVNGRDYAYLGTMPTGGGERMYVWDVTDPADLVLSDSVAIDARRVNDVKVNDDATWAIVTREQNSARGNGIVVLDLSDPAHPTVLSELTENLTAGVHNVWINGDIVYAVNDGTNALHIIDLSDPASPAHVGIWDVRPGEDDKTLHDVWAQDGLAYLSYWDDGLVILDIGAGIKGGTPTEPQFVSQYKYRVDHGEEYGNTHTAFRYGDYVFVGDEIFGCSACINGPRGYIHVIDVSDIENPFEVAKYEVPEAGAHNVWVEDDILYVAYYQAGLRIVDISGELRGDLYRQGREIGSYHTAGDEEDSYTPNQAFAWGPHPFKGNVFVSDNSSGLWVLHHEPPRPLVP
jgi:hypothetical protein